MTRELTHSGLYILSFGFVRFSHELMKGRKSAALDPVGTDLVLKLRVQDAFLRLKLLLVQFASGLQPPELVPQRRQLFGRAAELWTGDTNPSHLSTHSHCFGFVQTAQI